MTTDIGQYAPVFLPGESHGQTSLAAHSPQYCKELDYSSIHTRPFSPVAALPQGELSVTVAQLLGLWGPWWRQVCRDMDCLCHRSYGPIRVFFQASWSWWSEGLFGQSFSIAPPIQALRGLPCLGSFSVVWHIKHAEGPPSLASYSLDLHVRHLKGYPGWGPTL